VKNYSNQGFEGVKSDDFQVFLRFSMIRECGMPARASRKPRNSCRFDTLHLQSFYCNLSDDCAQGARHRFRRWRRKRTHCDAYLAAFRRTNKFGVGRRKEGIGSQVPRADRPPDRRSEKRPSDRAAGQRRFQQLPFFWTTLITPLTLLKGMLKYQCERPNSYF
jgi:hypothetical protein